MWSKNGSVIEMTLPGFVLAPVSHVVRIDARAFSRDFDNPPEKLTALGYGEQNLKIPDHWLRARIAGLRFDALRYFWLDNP